MTPYIILSGKNPLDLQDKVNQTIAQGYFVIGALVGNPINGTLFQALVYNSNN